MSPICSAINWEDDLSSKGLLPDFEAGCLPVGLATLEQGSRTSAIGTTKQTYPKFFVGTWQDRSHEAAWLCHSESGAGV